jgi:hypothetical protein
MRPFTVWHRCSAHAAVLTPLLAVIISCDWHSGAGELSAAGGTHWASSTHESDVRSLIRADTACECIRLEMQIIFGDTAGPGYVVHSTYAVRDSLGRYWVGQYKDMMKVFDAAGRYVATVGRRGEGPGEYDTPMPIYTDTFGRVHVVDAGLPRETVVSPQFQVHTTNRLPVIPWSIAPLGEQGVFVANVPIQSVQSLGHPLHLIHGAELVRSFGAPQTGITDPFNVRRVITTDHANRIYSARGDAFKVEVWTEKGERITAFEGPPLRINDPKSEPNVLYTPATTISTLHVDRSERLWLLIAEPRDDWRNHMDIVPLRDGRMRLQPKNDDSSSIYSTRIVVVDLATSTIITDTRRAERFVAFLGDRSLLELRQLENGIPQMAVWNVQFNANP